MPKIRFILFVGAQFLISVIGFSQKKKIDLEAGIRFRITPVYISGYKTLIFDPRFILLQTDKHISGLSVMAGINYSVTEKICINYQVYIRYDEFAVQLDSSGVPTNMLPSKKIFLDHQLALTYRILSHPKFKIDAGLGFSYNNLNSEYAYSFKQLNPFTGYMETIAGTDDYKFATLDIPIDFIFNDRLVLGLKNSVTARHKFLDPSELLLFSLSLRHKIKI